MTYIYQIYIHHALSFDRLASPAFQDVYQSFLPLCGRIVLYGKSLYRLNHLIFICSIGYIWDILKFCLSLQVFKQISCPFLTIGSCTKVFLTERWNCHPVRYFHQSGLWLFCHQNIFFSAWSYFFPLWNYLNKNGITRYYLLEHGIISRAQLTRLLHNHNFNLKFNNLFISYPVFKNLHYSYLKFQT